MHYHARSRLVFSACWPFLKTQLLVEFALKWLNVLQSGGIVTKLFFFMALIYKAVTYVFLILTVIVPTKCKERESCRLVKPPDDPKL